MHSKNELLTCVNEAAMGRPSSSDRTPAGSGSSSSKPATSGAWGGSCVGARAVATRAYLWCEMRETCGTSKEAGTDSSNGSALAATAASSASAFCLRPSSPSAALCASTRADSFATCSSLSALLGLPTTHTASAATISPQVRTQKDASSASSRPR